MTALFRRFPTLQRHIPHTPVGQLPTPVESLPLPGGPLWIKRDDKSGEVYGGNKVRKLAFLLADAAARGCEAIWTVGAIGSHHALATAIYGARAGLAVHVLHFPQPVTDHVLDNLRAISGTGARFRLTAHENTLPLGMAAMHLAMRKQYGDKVAFIPAGGSNAVGVLGLVDGVMELAEQIRDGLLPEPARIFAPLGSGSTFAGLWLGCQLAGLDTQVIGVRTVDLIASNEVLATRLIRQASALLHAADPTIPLVSPSPWALDVRHSHFGRGYGAPTEAGQRALARFEGLGLHLDPTYTAKTAAAVLDTLDNGEPTLLWHTLSSADLSPLIAAANLDALPDGYQRFLTDQTPRTP